MWRDKLEPGKWSHTNRQCIRVAHKYALSFTLSCCACMSIVLAWPLHKVSSITFRNFSALCDRLPSLSWYNSGGETRSCYMCSSLFHNDTIQTGSILLSLSADQVDKCMWTWTHSLKGLWYLVGPCSPLVWHLGLSQKYSICKSFRFVNLPTY